MRYHVPNLAAGWLHKGPQTSPDDHFGGAPWGMPRERWPKCAKCGAFMTFIAQFRRDVARLDLGADGRMLYLFWCTQDPGMCEIWEPAARVSEHMPRPLSLTEPRPYTPPRYGTTYACP